MSDKQNSVALVVGADGDVDSGGTDGGGVRNYHQSGSITIGLAVSLRTINAAKVQVTSRTRPKSWHCYGTAPRLTIYSSVCDWEEGIQGAEWSHYAENRG